MRTLLLLRHAKSDRSAPSPSDHERPLNPRGRAAAARMGRFLSRLEQVPDLVVTSSALRARSTVALAAEAGGWSCPVKPSDALYGASPDAVLARIQELDDALHRVLLVGHEPTWSNLAARLTGGGEPRFPTAGLARLDFDAARWSQIRFGGGTLVWLVTPKLLARGGLDGPRGKP